VGDIRDEALVRRYRTHAERGAEQLVGPTGGRNSQAARTGGMRLSVCGRYFTPAYGERGSHKSKLHVQCMSNIAVVPKQDRWVSFHAPAERDGGWYASGHVVRWYVVLTGTCPLRQRGLWRSGTARA
jgi:hypothetical protein